MKQVMQKISQKGYEAALQARANLATARMMTPATAGRLARRQTGATMVEYAILVALIAIAVILTVVLLGQQINDVFQTVVNCVQQPSTDNCTLPGGGT